MSSSRWRVDQSSSSHSRMSPGWQSSALQMASNVVKRTALASSVLQNGHVGGSDRQFVRRARRRRSCVWPSLTVEIDANRHLKSPARVRARAGQGEQFPYGHERRFDAEQEQHAHNEIWPAHRRLARVEAGQRAAQIPVRRIVGPIGRPARPESRWLSTRATPIGACQFFIARSFQVPTFFWRHREHRYDYIEKRYTLQGVLRQPASVRSSVHMASADCQQTRQLNGANAI